jgi:hypothetical protein
MIVEHDERCGAAERDLAKHVARLDWCTISGVNQVQ